MPSRAPSRTQCLRDPLLPRLPSVRPPRPRRPAPAPPAGRGDAPTLSSAPAYAPTATGLCPSCARPLTKGIPPAAMPHASSHNPLSGPRTRLPKPPSRPGKVPCKSPSPVTHPLQTVFPATAHAAVTPDSGARRPRRAARRAGPRPSHPNMGGHALFPFSGGTGHAPSFQLGWWSSPLADVSSPSHAPSDVCGSKLRPLPHRRVETQCSLRTRSGSGRRPSLRPYPL